ncbi:MAG: glycosyltransferase [Chloroflexi bacterium]|nr:glycosyltransferase [Chloroflexota bacterium]
MSLRLSVCIPCYVEPPEVLQTAIDSAAMQLPEESELLIFPNGPEALAATESVTIPEDARVIPSKELLSMAGNWNRCLGESRGELIHILHADDAVAPGFYQAVLELAARYPQAALYATGFGPLVEGVPASIGTQAGETRLLAGEAAGPGDGSGACGHRPHLRLPPIRVREQQCAVQAGPVRAADRSSGLARRLPPAGRRGDSEHRPRFVLAVSRRVAVGAAGFGGGGRHQKEDRRRAMGTRPRRGRRWRPAAANRPPRSRWLHGCVR